MDTQIPDLKTQTLNALLGAGAKIAPTPTVNTTVDASKFDSATPYSLPKIEQAPTPDVSTVADTAKSLYSQFFPSEQTQAEKESSDLQSRLKTLVTSEGNRPADQLKAETDAGIPGLKQTVSDLSNSLFSLGNEATANKLKISEQPILGSIVGGQQARIDRESAVKALTISAQLHAAQGNLTLAQDNANRAIDTKYAQDENELKYFSDFLSLNKDKLDREDKKKADQLQIALTERKDQIDKQKANDTAIQNIALEAAKNGADQITLKAITSSADPISAINAGAKYIQDPNAAIDKQLKLAQLKKLNAETTALGVPQITNPQASQYSGALSVILGSSKFTKEQKASVVQSINTGEDPFAVIKNQAKNIMPNTQATQLDKYETIKTQIQDLSSLLTDYYANGGKTNIFSGNIEKTINKLGEVNDPKLVSIATNIAASLQAYRNAVSGTAYSEQEGKDIAAIFPGIDKSQGLNTAILNGRLQFINTTIDAQYRNTLGSTYDTLKAANPDKILKSPTQNGLLPVFNISLPGGKTLNLSTFEK